MDAAMNEIIQRLTQHEAAIERGLKTFVEVGQALQAIRDGRLYRESFPNFEAYCSTRWGFTKSYANNVIAGAEVVRELDNNCCHKLPATESQARPLTKLPATEQADAWGEVVAESEESGEKITARRVEQVATTSLIPSILLTYKLFPMFEANFFHHASLDKQLLYSFYHF
ncbi:MAG: hypothetical protein AAF085_05420 [Planctomycetota bacterium]